MGSETNLFKTSQPKFTVLKRNGFDLISRNGGALNLCGEYLDGVKDGNFTKTYDNGWTLSGYAQDDWRLWVNLFFATHHKYGMVWGDFEINVFAETEEAYQDFVKHFPPMDWDYHDI